MESYHYIRDARENYEYLLKRFNTYSECQYNIDFVYYSKEEDSQLRDLFETYKLSRFLHEGNEIDIFLRTLQWSHEVLLYTALGEYDGRECATEIIRFCKEHQLTVNCRLHAIVLTEALLSLGYPARLVVCMPIDVLPFDSHAMTVVYSQKLNKWIALDSARNCCFMDMCGKLLSIAELRQRLIQNRGVEFHYMHRFDKIKSENGATQFGNEWYMDYLYKNLFRFYCQRINGTTSETIQVIYHLVPVGYADCNEKPILDETGKKVSIIKNIDNDKLFWSPPQ